MQASMPAVASIKGKPIFDGGSPAVPVDRVMPDAACTT